LGEYTLLCTIIFILLYYSLFMYTSKWYSRGMTSLYVLYLVPKLRQKYDGKKELALNERQNPAVFNFKVFIFNHLSICSFNSDFSSNIITFDRISNSFHFHFLHCLSLTSYSIPILWLRISCFGILHTWVQTAWLPLLLQPCFAPQIFSQKLVLSFFVSLELRWDRYLFQLVEV
jgi:hypothetical protein